MGLFNAARTHAAHAKSRKSKQMPEPPRSQLDLTFWLAFCQRPFVVVVVAAALFRWFRLWPGFSQKCSQVSTAGPSIASGCRSPTRMSRTRRWSSLRSSRDSSRVKASKDPELPLPHPKPTFRAPPPQPNRFTTEEHVKPDLRSMHPLHPRAPLMQPSWMRARACVRVVK